jgi:uncharacterized protein YjbJ (UPF0337 family)
VYITFEILGIAGEEYEFKWVKITIYLDPLNHSEQIRFLIKIVLEPSDLSSKDNFSEPIHIYLKSNREIKIKNGEILNKSQKIQNVTYQEGIGADKIVKKANVLRMEPDIVNKTGEDNRISIKITPKKEEMKKNFQEIKEMIKYKKKNRRYRRRIWRFQEIIEERREKIKEYEGKIKEYEGKIKEYEGKIKEYEGKIKEYEGKIKEYEGKYEPETKFGFMIDTVIQNEGIEEEPFWKNLLGLSQFAWKFHFKVWSMMEYLEPIEHIATKSSEKVQMFLVVPKSLFKSYGQIVAHPGEESMHSMTKKDKNIFLLSENYEGKNREKTKERIDYWFEEKAMASSWEHGQTGSMSREAVVEHRKAYPRSLTILTVVFLGLILGMEPLLEKLPKETADSYSGWPIFLMVLFAFLYFLANIHNYSFYELKKKGLKKFLTDFLTTFVKSLIVIFVGFAIFNNLIGQNIENKEITLFSVLVMCVFIITIFTEIKKIEKEDPNIKGNKMIFYLIIRLAIQLSSIALAVFLFTNLKPVVDYPFIFFCYVYAVVLGLRDYRDLI